MNKDVFAGLILLGCFIGGWYYLMGPVGTMIGVSLALHYVAMKDSY